MEAWISGRDDWLAGLEPAEWMTAAWLDEGVSGHGPQRISEAMSCAVYKLSARGVCVCCCCQTAGLTLRALLWVRRCWRRAVAPGSGRSRTHGCGSCGGSPRPTWRHGSAEPVPAAAAAAAAALAAGRRCPLAARQPGPGRWRSEGRERGAVHGARLSPCARHSSGTTTPSSPFPCPRLFVVGSLPISYRSRFECTADLAFVVSGPVRR